MSIYFLRHCQSLFNQKGLSVCDVQLSEDGKIHAASLSGKFDIVLCSPLKRARQTLELSKIIYDTLEICPEARENLEGNIINYFQDEKIVRETKENFEERMGRFKTKLYTLASQGKSVLVIGHHDFFFKLTGYRLKNGQMVQIGIFETKTN